MWKLDSYHESTFMVYFFWQKFHEAKHKISIVPKVRGLSSLLNTVYLKLILFFRCK